MAQSITWFTNRLGLLSLWLSIFACAQGYELKWTTPHQAVGGASLWGATASDFGAIAVGSGGKILLSTDGVQWIEQNSGTTEWLLGVAFGAGKFIAVGDHGTMLQSVDGKTWTSISSSPTTARLNNILFAQDHFVAVGEAGTILVSSGNDWQVVPSSVSRWLRGIAFHRGLWVITGEQGTVLVSKNLFSWQSVTTGTSVDLEAVGYDQTENLFLGGTASLGLPPNEPATTSAYDLFAVGGASGFWATCREFVGEGSSAPTSFPTFDPLVSNLTSSRFRTAVSGAGVMILAGEEGKVFQRTGDYDFGAGPPPQPIAVGTSATFNGGTVFADSILLVGTGETIVRGAGLYRSRLANVSTRISVGPGEAAPIAGLVTDGRRGLLIRAIGPSLKQFGVAHPLPHPTLTVYNSAGTIIEPLPPSPNGRTYVEGATHKIGAFPFSDVGDAAAYLYLEAGAYTVRVTDAQNATGVVLLEVYDDPDLGGLPRFGALRSGAHEPRVANLSTRGMVGAGENTLIGGFIIGGETSREVLIRAAGPSLASLGIGNPATAPTLSLFAAGGAMLAVNAGWTRDTPVSGKTISAADIRQANTVVGAFPFPEGSHDAALLLTLPPGAYTAHVTDPAGQVGIALLEVYEVKR